MKKIISASLAALIITSASTALASGIIPDHRGTPMETIAAGTERLSSSVGGYNELFRTSGERYGVDPNLLAAICMQESSGRNLSYREDGTPYPAWGIMQIEYTNEKSFAEFGEKTTGTAWTLEDRLDPAKAVPYAAWLISQSLYNYDCDYMKTIQSYNFGQIVLDRIIEDKGDEWMGYRADAVKYVSGWPYNTYGDAQYIEHVMRYYYNNIEYRGARVRLNGELVRFEDQAPVIIDGTTLIPVRAVSELLGAQAEWDEKNCRAVITGEDVTLTIPINSATAYIDDRAVGLNTCASIMNGRTMVPLRFIAEAFDVGVDWEQDTRTVMITG